MPVEKDGYREKSLEGFGCWIRERRFSCLIPRLIPPIDHPFIPLLNQKETCLIVMPILVNTDPADETQMCFRVLCE